MANSNHGVMPKPIVFDASSRWDGNDGHWSTFTVRVGTPEQNFRVLPAASLGQVIVPHQLGCSANSSDDCPNLRGVYASDANPSRGFQANASTSWSELGIFGMNFKTLVRLGYKANASYGLDNVGLMIQNSGGPTMPKQVVATVASKVYWLGFFGLDRRPSNFSGFDYPQRSYITTLKDEKVIPSLSYGYTAGAYYGTPKIFGSLTMGGYDKSRLMPNNITFPFDPDDSMPTSLTIQRISASNTLEGSVSLLDKAIYATIDYSVPHLWLPRATCDRFEAKFGLQYDNSTGLYLVNDTIHEQLLKHNPSITISLANTDNPSEYVSIALPYAAFDLQASSPIYLNATNYFPIRRATNDSQFTLGRTFMQEAYMVVDYERGNFSVHQARFPASNDQNIVTIQSKDYTQEAPKELHHGKKLSNGQVAGITVGVIVFAVICLALTILLLRRHKQRKAELERAAEENSKGESLVFAPVNGLGDFEKRGTEAMSNAIMEMQGEADNELAGTPRAELECTPHELHVDEPPVRLAP